MQADRGTGDDCNAGPTVCAGIGRIGSNDPDTRCGGYQDQVRATRKRFRDSIKQKLGPAEGACLDHDQRRRSSKSGLAAATPWDCEEMPHWLAELPLGRAARVLARTRDAGSGSQA
jgi:hypothetical protein